MRYIQARRINKLTTDIIISLGIFNILAKTLIGRKQQNTQIPEHRKHTQTTKQSKQKHTNK
jgi:hypothetical protein